MCKHRKSPDLSWSVRQLLYTAPFIGLSGKIWLLLKFVFISWGQGRIPMIPMALSEFNCWRLLEICELDCSCVKGMKVCYPAPLECFQSQQRNVCLGETYGKGHNEGHSMKSLANSVSLLSTVGNLLPSGVRSRWTPPRKSKTSSPSHFSAPCLGRRRWRAGSTSAEDGSALWNAWPRWRESRPTHSSLSAVSGYSEARTAGLTPIKAQVKWKSRLSHVLLLN